MVIRIVKFIETERIVVVRDKGHRRGELLFDVYRIPGLENEKMS